MAALLTGVSIASADTRLIPAGEVGSAEIGSLPTDVAIEDSTGYVLVVDPEGNRVVVFESSEPGAPVLTTFGAGELSSPYGIAIDQTSGEVYVSDSGNDRIVRYTSDGAPTPTYTRDTTYVGPATGSGAGQIGSFASKMAIDPSNGDLLVADAGNLEVKRFDSSGNFISRFNGSTAPTGPFTGLADIDVGADRTIYVVANGLLASSRVMEHAIVESFGPAGAIVARYGISIRNMESARSLSVDPATGDLIVGTGGGGDDLGNFRATQILVFHKGGLVQSLESPGFEVSAPAGIAFPPSPAEPAALLTTTTGSGGVTAVEALGTLDLNIAQPAPVGANTARLSGVVNTHGLAGVNVWFEYRLVGSSTWSSTLEQPVAATTSLELVEAELVELLSNGEYETRLTATLNGVIVSGVPTNFKTAVAPPIVETLQASGVSGAEATLNGSVDSLGAATTYRFEYGLTTAYGATVPFGGAPIGAERAVRVVSQTVAGLQPETTYHFRVVAENSAGPVDGTDRTLRTLSAISPVRAYEQVTPIDKQGARPDEVVDVHALPDAEGVAYVVRGNPEGQSGNPIYARFLSTRSSSGWSGWKSLDPPFALVGNGLTFVTTLAVSDDGSHAFVVSNEALTPGAVATAGGANLYREDVATGALTYVGTTTNANAFFSFTGNIEQDDFLAGAPDFHWLYFGSKFPLLPGVNGFALYRWSTESGLELASTLPGGGIPSGPAKRITSANVIERFASTDGSRLFFSLGGGPAYVREGNEVAPISRSEIDGLVKPAVFFDTDVEGHYAYFFSEGGLTADAPASVGPNEAAIYRYDLETEDLAYVGVGWSTDTLEAIDSPLAVARDGSKIFFQTPAGELMEWDEGASRVVGELPLTGGIVPASMSPNGRFLSYFQSGDIYRLDSVSESIECASCLRGGTTGTAFPPAYLEFVRAFDNSRPPWVNNAGEIFFTTPIALVPSDTNGVNDVYVYREGQASLVSSGTGNSAAVLGTISEDGRDVYFLTGQGLVAQDIDGQRDMYDARLGGGIASQNVTPPPPCVGEGCQGSSISVAPAPVIGSEGGGAKPPGRVSAKHCKQTKDKCQRKGKKKGKKDSKGRGKQKNHGRKGGKK
jgi:hypothetical protein